MPKKKGATPIVQVNLRCPPDLRQRVLDHQFANSYFSMNDTIIKLIEAGLAAGKPA